MKISFNFELQRKRYHQKMAHLNNDDKGLSIDEENRFFHFRVTFSNSGHPQFCIEDKFLKLYGGNLFAYLQTLLPTWFAFSKRSNFSHNANYAKKYERQNNVKRW